MPNSAPTLHFISTLSLADQATDAREITLELLRSQSDVSGSDGSISGFEVSSVQAGQLLIGTDLASATPWNSDSNRLIDATHNAYWTPRVDQAGAQNAFTVQAKDNESALSAQAVLVKAEVQINQIPVFHAYSDNGFLATKKNTFREISAAYLAKNSDFSDSDGYINAFVVDSVSSGTLLIGDTLATAKPWDAASNAVIGQGLRAYWKPDLNALGNQTAFSIRIRDEDRGVSADAKLVTCSVYSTNQLPAITDTQTLIHTEIGKATRIDFSSLKSSAGAYDRDGTVEAFVVKELGSGILTINGKPWSAKTNYVIAADDVAYWQPSEGSTGIFNALKVAARDDSRATSSTIMQVQVEVHEAPITPPPQPLSAPYFSNSQFPNPTSFSIEHISRVNQEREIRFDDIQNPSGAGDADGSIAYFAVTSVNSGSLRIGRSADTATPWDALTNFKIDGSEHIAYWTPAPDESGQENAFTVYAVDDDGLSTPHGAQVIINVSGGNQAPILLSGHGDIPSTAVNQVATVSFARLSNMADARDYDGSVNAFVVTSVVMGELKIGTSIGNATAWNAQTNSVIDAQHTAFWTPDPNSAHTTPIAFTIKARDNDLATSLDSGLVPIKVRGAVENFSPTFSELTVQADFDAAETMEMHLMDFLAFSNAKTSAGAFISSLSISSVWGAELKIGVTKESATPWDAQSNHVVDAAHHAYWTIQAENGLQAGFSARVTDSLGRESQRDVQANLVDPWHAPNSNPFFSYANLQSVADEAGDVYFNSPSLRVEDGELGRNGNYGGTTLTVSRTGAVDGQGTFFGVNKVFFDADRVMLRIPHSVKSETNVDATVVYEDIAVGSFFIEEGKLSITFNEAAGWSSVNDVIQGLAFQPGETLTAATGLSWAFTDGAGGSANIWQPIVSPDNFIKGTWSSESLLPSLPGQNAQLEGSMGDDSLTGTNLNDVLDGGAGNDRMVGGLGDDVYIVDSTKDVVQELNAEGEDMVITSVSNYKMGDYIENLVNGRYLSRFSGKGNALDNSMVVDAGSVSLDGGDGNDYLAANGNTTNLIGGNGNDTIYSMAGKSTAKGGEGDDLFITTAKWSTSSLDGGDGNDTFIGGDGQHAIKGGNGDDEIYCGGGNDRIDAGSGDDLIVAGEGKNAVVAGMGRDLIYSGDWDDSLDGGEGDDEIFAGHGNNSIKAGDGSDLVLAGKDDDKIDGQSGNDTLYGGNGKNSIYGGDGDDLLVSGVSYSKSTLDGGTGNDVLHAINNAILIGGDGFDTFVIEALVQDSDVNTIKDFSVLNDHIQLDRLVFSEIGDAGALLESAFVLGSAATTASHRIIVDQKAHTLSYDADGSGSLEAHLIAKLMGDLSQLNAGSFQVI